MPDPFVGLPILDSVIAQCSFGGADIDGPGCPRSPAVHVVGHSKAWGNVGLATCATHLPIARAAVELHDQHPYGPDCDSLRCSNG